jgi:hypothetical protein
MRTLPFSSLPFICVLLFILICGATAASPAVAVEPTRISEYTAGLDRLVAIWAEVHDLHEYLDDLQPVAVVASDSLVIFEPDSSGVAYYHHATVAAPFPMAPGIRAAFPLAATQGRPACVVSEEVFESDEELVLLLHEFVHCSQGKTVEYEIKATLKVATEAAEREDHMWELEHPFPYADPEFVQNYAAMIAALADGDAEGAIARRNALREYLSVTDYEYMVWQEWKEGLARYLENRIQEKLGLTVNTFGNEAPYHRISFYYSGALWIEHLVHSRPALNGDPMALFKALQ